MNAQPKRNLGCGVFTKHESERRPQMRIFQTDEDRKVMVAKPEEVVVMTGTLMEVNLMQKIHSRPFFPKSR